MASGVSRLKSVKPTKVKRRSQTLALNHPRSPSRQRGDPEVTDTRDDEAVRQPDIARRSTREIQSAQLIDLELSAARIYGEVDISGNGFALLGDINESRFVQIQQAHFHNNSGRNLLRELKLITNEATARCRRLITHLRSGAPADEYPDANSENNEPPSIDQRQNLNERDCRGTERQVPAEGETDHVRSHSQILVRSTPVRSSVIYHDWNILPIETQNTKKVMELFDAAIACTLSGRHQCDDTNDGLCYVYEKVAEADLQHEQELFHQMRLTLVEVNETTDALFHRPTIKSVIAVMRILHRNIFYGDLVRFKVVYDLLCRRATEELSVGHPLHLLIQHYGECFDDCRLPSVAWEHAFRQVAKSLRHIEVTGSDERAIRTRTARISRCTTDSENLVQLSAPRYVQEKARLRKSISDHNAYVLNFAKQGLARRLLDNGILGQAEKLCEELRYTHLSDPENERIRAWATHDLAWINQKKGDTANAMHYYQDALRWMSAATGEVSSSTITIFAHVVQILHHNYNDLALLFQRYPRLVARFDRNKAWPWKGTRDDWLAYLYHKSHVEEYDDSFEGSPGVGSGQSTI